VDRRLAEAEEALERLASTGIRQQQVARNIAHRLHYSWDRQSAEARHELGRVETGEDKIRLALALLAMHRTRDLARTNWKEN
jgi:molybdopterin synthase catalytic subunit